MSVDDPKTPRKHSEHSTFREKLIEHLLIGELLKRSWQTGDCSIEISKPEVDRAGYDLIAECNGQIRHIQLKTSFRGSSTSELNIQLALAEKPAACVVWVVFDEETLELGPFWYLGPGGGLKNLKSFRVAKHTKANALGEKTERRNLRVVRKSDFTRVEDLTGLWHCLFGGEAAT